MAQPLHAVSPLQAAYSSVHQSYGLELVQDLLHNTEITVKDACSAWRRLFESHKVRGVTYRDETLILGSPEGFMYLKSPGAITGLLVCIEQYNRQNTGSQIFSLQFDKVIVTEKAWQAFVDTLDKTSDIQALHFLECALDHAQLQYLFRQMRGFKDRLKVLSIDDNDISPFGAREIGMFLKENPPLQILSLQNDKISDETLKSIFDSGLKANTRLAELDLGMNYIGDAGILDLSLWLHHHPSLKYLVINNNEIGDKGIKWLSLSLADSAVRVLNIAENTGVTHEGVLTLLREAPRLEGLDLSNNYLVQSPDVLREALLHKSLKQIKLCRTGVNDPVIGVFNQMPIDVPPARALKFVFTTIDGFLTIDGLSTLQRKVQNTAVKVQLVLAKNQNESRPQEPIASYMPESYTPVSPIFNDPLYIECQAAEKPTAELLAKIRTYKHQDDPLKILMLERCFKTLLSKQYDIVEIDPDGNCLFASISECIGHQHAQDAKEGKCKDHVNDADLRHVLVNYMRNNMLEQVVFLADHELSGSTPEEQLSNYCNHMALPKQWGGEFELQAFIGLFGHDDFKIRRPIWIFDRFYPLIVAEGEIRIGDKCKDELIRGSHFEGPPILLYRSNQNHYSAMFPKVKQQQEVKTQKQDDPQGPDLKRARPSPEQPKPG